MKKNNTQTLSSRKKQTGFPRGKNRISSPLFIGFALFLAFIFGGFALQSVLAVAWSPPSGAPPANNSEPPINTSVTAQEKTGALTSLQFASRFDAYLATDGGSVAVGTATPPAAGIKLEVVGGTVKTTGGFIIEGRTGDPASPETGRIWLRTDL